MANSLFASLFRKSSHFGRPLARDRSRYFRRGWRRHEVEALELRTLLSNAGLTQLTLEPTGNETAHGAIIVSSDAESFTNGEILPPFETAAPDAARHVDFPIVDSGTRYVDLWYTRLDGAEVTDKIRRIGTHPAGPFLYYLHDLNGSGAATAPAALESVLAEDWALPGEAIAAGTTIYADYSGLVVDHTKPSSFYFDTTTQTHHVVYEHGEFELFRETAPGAYETIAAWDEVVVELETDYSNFTGQGTEVVTVAWSGTPSVDGRWQIPAEATGSADDIILDTLGLLQSELQVSPADAVMGFIARGSVYAYQFSFDTENAIETPSTRVLASSDSRDPEIDLIGLTADGGIAIYTADSGTSGTGNMLVGLYSIPTAGGSPTLLYPDVDVERTRPILAGQQVIFVTDDLTEDELRSVPIIGGSSLTLHQGELDSNAGEIEVWGDHVLFTDIPEGDFDARLYSVPIRGGQKIELANELRGENEKDRFAVSSNGRVLFVGRVGDDAGPVGFNSVGLYSVPVDGQTHSLIEISGSIEVQDFQVRDERVIYRTFDTNDGVGWQDLFVAMADGSGVSRRLTPDDQGYIEQSIAQGNEYDLQYVVSEDGSAVFYHFKYASSDGSQDGLYRASTTGPDDIQQVDNRDNFSLVSSPDGTFAIVRTQFFEYFALDIVSTAGVRQITDGYGGDLEFTLSADGSRIVYQRNNTDDFSDQGVLYSQLTDGSGADVRLTPPQHMASESGFLIDDETLFYFADPEDDSHYQLYSVPIDGSASPRQVSDPSVAPGLADNRDSVANQEIPALALAENGSVILYHRDSYREDDQPRESALYATSLVQITSGPEFDFGDAPESYGLASHESVGVRLGAERDVDEVANTSLDATGDDTTGVDDEDGVTFELLFAGETSSMTVDVQEIGVDGAWVTAWIDADGDGSWHPTTERFIQEFVTTNGSKTFDVVLPESAVAGTTFARVRISSSGEAAVSGLLPDGEVEDYVVSIVPQNADGVYFVTDFEDSLDGDFSDGNLSLREAVLLANHDGVDSTINLAAGTYILAIAGSDEDDGLTGDLDVFNDGSLTIIGAGAGQTIIDAGGSGGIRDRVFDVYTTMTLESLTVAGGYAVREAGQPGQYGGGIRYSLTTSDKPLTVLNSEITGNWAENGGGGIYVPNHAGGGVSAKVNILNSVISHNRAASGGGGGVISTIVVADGSSFHNNSAPGNGGAILTPRPSLANSSFYANSGYAGSAIWIAGIPGVTGSIKNVSFYDNNSVEGTIAVSSGSYRLNVTNSTIVGNTGSGPGFRSSGANFNNFAPVITTFTNSTIAGNSGPGFDIRSHSTVYLNNTIVAGNGVSGGQIDLRTEEVSASGFIGSHSLIGNPNQPGFRNTSQVGVLVHGVDGNIVGNDGVGVIDPTTIFVDVNSDGLINADDLADNGGPTLTLTLTLALRGDGPAVDAGNNTLALNAGLTNDQRGVGFPRVLGGIVDMGAFEAEAAENQQPSAEDASATTDEDAGVFSFDANALVSDADASDVLAITSILQVSGRSITFESIGGVLSFDADQFNDLAIGESESLVFTYTVDDQQDQANSTNTGMLTITIEGRNDSPILQPLNGTGSITLNEDADVSIPLLISDADGDRLYSPPGQGDVLTVTVSHDNPTLFGNDDLSIVNSNPRELRIRPRADAFGSATVTVVVSDGTDSVSRQLNVTVLPVNDPPVATIGFFDDKQTDQNKPLTPNHVIYDIERNLYASDFTFTTSNPTLLPIENITINTWFDGEVRDFTYTPLPNQFGEVIVGVTASDGIDSLTGSFRLIVHPVDAAAPVSLMQPLPAFASSLEIPLQWSAADATGQIVSGVDTVTVQYAIASRLTADTEWTTWQTFDAGVTTAPFMAESNRKYWFRTIATDAAGNVEAKVGADTRIQVGDGDAPITRIHTATIEDDGIRLRIDGQDGALGSGVSHFDVYASVDGADPVRVGTVSPEIITLDLEGGNNIFHSTFFYPGNADGIQRSYVFYSVGVDGVGNIEDPPTVSGEDVSLTHTFEPETLRVLHFDVQRGLQQRSFINTLDVTFNTTDVAVLQDLIDNNRLNLEKFAINSAAADVGQGTGQVVDLSTATFEIVNGATIRIHLGNALNSQANPYQSNGFYRLSIDTNTNNVFDESDAQMEFFRLYGDRNGDGRIDSDDSFQLDRATLVDLNNDLNGDGVVNRNDTRIYQTWNYFSQRRPGLRDDDPLALLLDDYLGVLNDELLGFLDD